MGYNMSRWTIEARKKQSQFIQRWQPWKQATGAKTVRGKAISKMNALKHGRRSAEIRDAQKGFTQHKRMLCDVMNFN